MDTVVLGVPEEGKDGKPAVRTSSLWFVCDFESYLAHITVKIHMCRYFSCHTISHACRQTDRHTDIRTSIHGLKVATSLF